MLDYYVDIEILEDSEFSNQILLNAAYAKLHKQLSIKEGKIGVSFPRHTENFLGSLLRIHADETELLRLMSEKWYGNLFSYLKIGKVLKVPRNTEYRCVARVMEKKSIENRLRRAIKYNTKVTFDPNEVKEYIDKPYIVIKSISNQNTFKIFIDHKEIKNRVNYSREPVFSSYGLSDHVPIPWF